MLKRFKEVSESKALPHELLHVVTLTQEVRLLLTKVLPLLSVFLGVPSLRDRDDTLQGGFGHQAEQVRRCKLSFLSMRHDKLPDICPSQQLTQHIKDIRTKSAAVLTEISNALISRAEAEATAESRKAVTDACKPIIRDSGVRFTIHLPVPLSDVCDNSSITTSS